MTHPAKKVILPASIFIKGALVNWYVYIIVCSDDSLYTGITTNMERRLRQHAAGRGAKYFRGRQPKALLYLESGHDRSGAGKRELQIKSLTRVRKQALAHLPTNVAASVALPLSPV